MNSQPFSQRPKDVDQFDNAVPFTFSVSNVSSYHAAHDLSKLSDTLARIKAFLSSPSQSEYPFTLETSTLRELLNR